MPNPLPARPNHVAVPADILIVEDHAATANALAGILRRLGHRVTVSYCVAEAMKACSTTCFPLLISDINLPDGSGYEVMRHMSRSGQTRGLALTALGEPEDITASLNAGFEEHLVKPVRVEHVLRFIAGCESGTKVRSTTG